MECFEFDFPLEHSVRENRTTFSDVPLFPKIFHSNVVFHLFSNQNLHEMAAIKAKQKLVIKNTHPLLSVYLISVRVNQISKQQFSVLYRS